jgi:nicotinate-nucleotide adenylyltransferase
VNSQRIGVLGGTFDPIHIGHLVTGLNVRHQLSLDLVLFVVAHHPWQKADRDVSPSAVRFAMVAAAVGGHEGLEASDLEIERGGTTYTADTLTTLRERHPDAELFLILGQDQAANLHTWDRVDAVRSLVTLVVVRRPGSVGTPPREGWRVVEVDVPSLDVSSSDLRARFSDGRPVDWLVPEPVVRIVEERGLYRLPR